MSHPSCGHQAPTGISDVMRRSDYEPGTVVNRKVSEMDESMEALSSRTVGMVQAGLAQGEVASKIGLPRRSSHYRISGGEDIAKVIR